MIEENDTGRNSGNKLESIGTKTTKKRSHTMLSKAIDKPSKKKSKITAGNSKYENNLDGLLIDQPKSGKDSAESFMTTTRAQYRTEDDMKIG